MSVAHCCVFLHIFMTSNTIIIIIIITNVNVYGGIVTKTLQGHL